LFCERIPSAKVKEKNGTFFYSFNFSLGVNLFFHFNQIIASVVICYSEYKVHIEETHHIHKKDAPSGTAITTAEGILSQNKLIEGWALNSKEQNKINIIAHRLDEVPGTHEVQYESEIDKIQLRHEAKSRMGFASGALMAAKWLVGKQGVFGMKEMLKLE
jgi:4-hydroxy-tetrahydrodipicolinate reductase